MLETLDTSQDVTKFANNPQSDWATTVAAAAARSARHLQDNSNDDEEETFAWTPWTVTQSILIFLITGVFEICGGWLVWQAVREGKPWWYAVVGSAVLVGYGFWPTLQHTAENDSFGRIYAIYGGFFVVGSFLAGWMLDGDRPDKGDWIGGSITLGGVLIILFWPRNGGGDDDDDDNRQAD